MTPATLTPEVEYALIEIADRVNFAGLSMRGAFHEVYRLGLAAALDQFIADVVGRDPDATLVFLASIRERAAAIRAAKEEK